MTYRPKESLLDLMESFVVLVNNIEDYRGNNKDEMSVEELEDMNIMMQTYEDIYLNFQTEDGKYLKDMMSFDEYLDNLIESTKKELKFRRQN